MLKSLFNIARNAVHRVKERVELNAYDTRTIAAYFRKQGAQVGEGCVIIPTWLGTEPYLIKIGNRVSIAKGVMFITHDGGAAVLRDEIPDMQVFGPIVIEDNCVIGQNVTIFGNVRIGANSIIGAGSVVIGDIAPNTVAMGIPARAFGSMERYREKCRERWAAQRPPDAILEPGETWWNSRHFDENREKLRRHLLNHFAVELELDQDKPQQ